MQEKEIRITKKDEYKEASKKITALKKEGKLDIALGICNDKKFKDNVIIQVQKISILMKLKRNTEALDICNSNLLKDNPSVEDLKIKILIKLNRLGETLEICEARSDAYALNKKKKILKRLEEPKKEDTKIILSKIKNKDITLEEIDALNLEKIEKIILTFAFYEVFNYPEKIILKYLKSKINEYSNNAEIIKIIKNIKTRFSNKTKVFDSLYYEELLLSTKNNIEDKRVFYTSLKDALSEEKDLREFKSR